MDVAVDLGCSGCSEVAARFRRVRLAIGRPFEECPKCRTLVGRPATNEWDLLRPVEKASWLASRVVPFLLAGFLPGAAYWAFAFRSGGGDRLTLLVLLCAVPTLLVLFSLTGGVRAIRRSRTRMADPMYRARLIQFSRKTLSTNR